MLQGVGAALVTPASLTLIREAYRDGPARARAIGHWALGGAIAAAAGPVLGGLLTALNWRLIFLVNLPVGIAALLVLRRVALSPRRAVRFDWAGQVSALVALSAVTFAVIEGAQWGYSSPAVLVAAAIAVAAGVVFVTSQLRGRHPMVPPALFASSTVRVMVMVTFVTMGGFYGVVFVQSLYFQELRGATPWVTGLMFLPMTASVAVLNPFIPRLASRVGPVVVIAGGQVVMVAGLIGLVMLPVTVPLWWVALMMAPVGLGGAFTVPPVAALFLDHVPVERAGTASGVLNTSRQVGGSLGVAVIGAIIATQSTFLDGLRIGLLVAAVAVLAAAGATLALGRRARRRNRDH
jgi:DHA2 family methylenomycin A resistance protein-like MFS transporter